MELPQPPPGSVSECHSPEGRGQSTTRDTQTSERGTHHSSGRGGCLPHVRAKAAMISKIHFLRNYSDITGSFMIDSTAESSQMEKIYLILWSVSNLS